jgi:hypothetical protein
MCRYSSCASMLCSNYVLVITERLQEVPSKLRTDNHRIFSRYSMQAM